MPGLGSLLRARWRVLLDVLRGRPSQPDAGVVDHRPRVRLPDPAESPGPPPEWLEYVLAQDPVWASGGIDVTGPRTDLAPTDRAPGDAPAASRVQPNGSRRVRARFVRPATVSDRGVAEPPTAVPVVAHGANDRTAAQLTAHTPSGIPSQAPHPTARLLPPASTAPERQPATGDPATPVRPDGPVARVLHQPDPAVSTAPRHRAPLRPVGVAAPAASPPATPQVPERRSPAVPAVALPHGQAGGAGAFLAPTPQRAVVPTPTPTPTTYRPTVDASHVGRAVDASHVGRAVDPWASGRSPAPVVELRREPEDRPAAVDPPVAVRWRAVDVDRLGIEQRAV